MYTSGVSMPTIDRAHAVARSTPSQPGVASSTDAADQGPSELREWISLLLGRSDRAVPLPLASDRGIDVTFGAAQVDDGPAFVRLTSRLARPDRSRRAATLCVPPRLADAPSESTYGARRMRCEHLSKVARESRLQLRDQASALGAHYRAIGVTADQIGSAAAGAVGRALALVPVTDRCVAEALRRDLVRWTRRGYETGASN